MQDTTSSAMTEVALGLSMAFFTLLIVALLSMSVPNENALKTVKVPEDLKENTAIKIKLEAINNNSENNLAKDKSTAQFAFYFNNAFYDQSLTRRSIDSFSQEQALIIAVDPQLAFTDVFTLRQQINHPTLSITTSNSAWRARLQQIITKG